MSTQRLQRIKLILLAMVGIVTAGVVYAADVTDMVAHAVVVDTTIDVGSIITLLVVIGGGISVWVKINRESATHQAQIDSIISRLDRHENSVSAVHERMDTFLFTSIGQHGKGAGRS